MYYYVVTMYIYVLLCMYNKEELLILIKGIIVKISVCVVLKHVYLPQL